MALPAKRLSILVVDDEPDIREIISVYISDVFPDAKIIETGDGSEAIQKMSVQRFDALITDVRMPRRDGFGVIQAASSFLDTTFTPRCIIVVSGHADARPDNSALPGVSFFPKPIEAEAFKNALRTRLTAMPSVAPKPAAAPQPGKFDVGFITPFIDSTLKVIQMTSGIEPAKKELFIRKPSQVSGDISALIAMNSQKYLGSMAISFEEKAFLEIVSAMLGETFTTITPEIQDAAAELCNQIFGMTKTAMNSQGHTLQPAIPSVVAGKGHSLTHSVQGPCLVVRFQIASGSFTVETAMQPIA